jgi:hypothetical protein
MKENEIAAAATKAIFFLKYPTSDPVDHAHDAATKLYNIVNCEIEEDESYEKDCYKVTLFAKHFEQPIYQKIVSFLKVLSYHTLCYEARIVLMRPIYPGDTKLSMREVPVFEARWEDEIYSAWAMQPALFNKFVVNNGDVIRAEQLFDIKFQNASLLFDYLGSEQILPYPARQAAALAGVTLQTEKIIKEAGLTVDYKALSDALTQIIQLPTTPKKGN